MGIASKVLPVKVKELLWRWMEGSMLLSLKAAVREQCLEPMSARLKQILPDISDHYTSFRLSTEYLQTSTRSQMAFQMALAALEFSGRQQAVVADIGDSSGAHIRYLKNIYPDGKFRYVSVNMDEEAVGRIRRRGYEAVCARAEDLAAHAIEADVFLCFETLEHLPDPITFLHNLAQRSGCDCLIVSVPYVRASRVGMQHIRNNNRKPVTSETTHIFELSPEDWKLIFRHSGWKVRSERIYLQYPRMSLWRLTRPLWKKIDFEGFYGAVLERDDTWASLYKSWS